MQASWSWATFFITLFADNVDDVTDSSTSPMVIFDTVSLLSVLRVSEDKDGLPMMNTLPDIDVVGIRLLVFMAMLEVTLLHKDTSGGGHSSFNSRILAIQLLPFVLVPLLLGHLFNRIPFSLRASFRLTTAFGDDGTFGSSVSASTSLDMTDGLFGFVSTASFVLSISSFLLVLRLCRLVTVPFTTVEEFGFAILDSTVTCVDAFLRPPVSVPLM